LDERKVNASVIGRETNRVSRNVITFADGTATLICSVVRMHEVVLPVLNEADGLPWVLNRLPAGFLAIVVDNGSTDGSGDLARSLGARVVEEPRRGFGAACYAGLLASTTDLVCFMDGDGSLDPQDLPAVTSPIVGGAADLVLGRRRAVGDAWPAHARVANRVVAWELSRRFGTSLHDIGPMRGARRASLLDLGLRDRRFGWPLEMVVRACERGWRVAEVPVTYSRRAGRSKVTGTLIGSLRAARDMARVLS
jgi:glycosyltransferase involved in cell wall biosynthesis